MANTTRAWCCTLPGGRSMLLPTAVLDRQSRLNLVCPALGPAYNLAVLHTQRLRPPPALWTRFATFLSFLAVLLALVSPVSMLADDVGTGKLGGVCSLTTLMASAADAGTPGDNGVPANGSHCEVCGSLALALPLLAVVTIPSFPGSQVAAVFLPADVAAPSISLPFSRGPPAL